jgi:hypothetical protein
MVCVRMGHECFRCGNIMTTGRSFKAANSRLFFIGTGTSYRLYEPVTHLPIKLCGGRHYYLRGIALDLLHSFLSGTNQQSLAYNSLASGSAWGSTGL